MLLHLAIHVKRFQNDVNNEGNEIFWRKYFYSTYNIASTSNIV